MTAAERTCAPGMMIAPGATDTYDEIRVVRPDPADEPYPYSAGEGEVGEVGENGVLLLLLLGAVGPEPMTLFSPMMQSSPIEMGPSYE